MLYFLIESKNPSTVYERSRLERDAQNNGPLLRGLGGTDEKAERREEGDRGAEHRRADAQGAFSRLVCLRSRSAHGSHRSLSSCVSTVDGPVGAQIAQNVSAAVFSHRAPWNDTEPEALGKGHTLSFRSALHGVLENVFMRMLLPKVRSPLVCSWTSD